MEYYSDLIGWIIGIIIFLLIFGIGVILYRKVMFPIPKRDTIIKKHYFLRDRFKIKKIIRYFEKDEICVVKELLQGLNYIPVNNMENIWYLFNEGDEYYLKLDYKNRILELVLFAESNFKLTKMNIILEQILDEKNTQNLIQAHLNQFHKNFLDYINDFDEITFEQIGDYFGISQEQVQSEIKYLLNKEEIIGRTTTNKLILNEEKPSQAIILSIPPQTKLSTLRCPRCNAPLTFMPPCKCDNCQVFIELDNNKNRKN
ncbi:MAG: hypothetical protein ACTSO9_09930 [Candidatus Helarchaeota archaeon]